MNFRDRFWYIYLARASCSTSRPRLVRANLSICDIDSDFLYARIYSSRQALREPPQLNVETISTNTEAAPNVLSLGANTKPHAGSLPLAQSGTIPSRTAGKDENATVWSWSHLWGSGKWPQMHFDPSEVAIHFLRRSSTAIHNFLHSGYERIFYGVVTII